METRDIALIKALSNGAGGASYTLPIASSDVLGGVQPADKTDAMTQAVGVDADGALWTEPGGGGGSPGGEIVDIFTINIDEEVATVSQEFTDAQREIIKGCNEILLTMHIVVPTTAPSDAQGTVTANFLGYNSGGGLVHRFGIVNGLRCIQKSGISYSTFSNVYIARKLTSFEFFLQYHDIIEFKNVSAGFADLISATINAPFTASNVAKNVFEAKASSAFGVGSYFTLRGKR